MKPGCLHDTYKFLPFRVVYLLNMYKIGVIEDDSVTRAGLVRFIESYPDLVCLAEAPSLADFWNRLPERANLDLLLIDINLPGQSGIEGLPALRRRFPEAELIMYTQSENEHDLFQALSLGATGYLLKNFPLTQLRQHIDTLLQGGALISTRMARKLIEYLNPPKRKPAPEQLLSEKEEQVLRLLAEGNSYEEAATLLGLSKDGVKYHVKNIYRKLNVDNRLEAVKLWNKKLI